MKLFEGVIEKDILKDILSFIGSFVSEARVKISDEGATFCFVNPENTVASYITIPWHCWDYYDFKAEEELEIGLDVRRTLEILPVFEGLITVAIEKDYKLNKETFTLAFLLKNGNLTYVIATIDPKAIRKCMPEKAFNEVKEKAQSGTKIVIESKILKELIKTAKQDLLYLESHDNEVIVYNGYRELEPLEFEGVVYNPSRALYQIRYLKPLTELKTAEEFEIYFATETPCYITTVLKHITREYAILEMLVAPYIPSEEKEWQEFAPKRVEYEHVITINIPKDLVRAIKHIKPNAIYIDENNNEIYFVYVIPKIRTSSYVVLKDIRGLWGMQGFYECVHNLAEFISEEITIGIVGDKLYINDIEVGSKATENFEVYKPSPSYNKISIPLEDFKNLISACGGETGRFAIIADGKCIRLVAITPEDEVVLSHCLFSPYEEKKIIRVPYIETLPRGIGDIVNIYYQGDLGSPIIFEYIKRKKREEIPLFYYNATPHPEMEKERIEELEKIIFKKPEMVMKEEKPPEEIPPAPKEIVEEADKVISEWDSLKKAFEDSYVTARDLYYKLLRQFEEIKKKKPTPEEVEKLINDFSSLGEIISKQISTLADFDNRVIKVQSEICKYDRNRCEKLKEIHEEIRKKVEDAETMLETVKKRIKDIEALMKTLEEINVEKEMARKWIEEAETSFDKYFEEYVKSVIAELKDKYDVLRSYSVDKLFEMFKKEHAKDIEEFKYQIVAECTSPEILEAYHYDTVESCVKHRIGLIVGKSPIIQEFLEKLAKKLEKEEKAEEIKPPKEVITVFDKLMDTFIVQLMLKGFREDEAREVAKQYETEIRDLAEKVEKGKIRQLKAMLKVIELSRKVKKTPVLKKIEESYEWIKRRLSEIERELPRIPPEYIDAELEELDNIIKSIDQSIEELRRLR